MMRRAIVMSMIGVMCACSGTLPDSHVRVACDAHTLVGAACRCGGQVCPDAPGGTGACAPDGCAIRCSRGHSMIDGACEPPVHGAPQELARTVADDNHECSSSICSP